MASDKKDYRNMRLDTEGYKDYLRKRTALSSFYGRMEQYQKDLQRRNENERQEYERQRQDAIRESMKHEQDDVRAEKQYRRYLDDKEKYENAVAAQTMRDVRGDDVRQEKSFMRYMDQLAQQQKLLDKQRQFNVSGDDVRQEKQYRRYMDALEQQKKLQAKANQFAASGEDVRTEKKYNRYLDKKADYEQQRKEFMDYLGSVGKNEKELTRAESRYLSAVNSWDKTKQKQPEISDEKKKEEDLQEWQEMLAQMSQAQKNSNNVLIGDMDKGTMWGERPEAVSQSWLIKNIDKQRKEMEADIEKGVYDNTGDVSLWSTKKREAQKKQNLDDEMRIQSELDEIHRKLNGETGMVRLEDADVQKYREILMGDYSDEEKEEAQARLEELYQQSEGEDLDREELVTQEKNLTSQLRYIRAQNEQIDGFNRREQKYKDTFGNYTPEDTEFHSDIERRYDFNGHTDVAYLYQLLEEKQLNGEHQIFGERNYPEAYLMNKNETEYFTSLVNNNKLDEAWEFYSGLRPFLNQMYSKYEKSMWEDAANRYPILSFFAARGANVLQIPQFVMSVPGYIDALVTGKENYSTDPYGKLSAESRIKNLIDNKISNNIGDYGWVYSGFASGVDSAINASIAQGLGLPEQVQFGDHIFKAQNVAMLSLFATQAFETSLQNVMAEGNNNFAYDFMEAFVDSVIETATEIWSVENFLAEPTNIMTYITKLAISEPSEEIAGAIVEPFIKEMIGHGNQYIQRADEIWHNGYYEDKDGNKIKVNSYEEAERKAMKEWIHDVHMAAASALISVAPGGMYGAAKMVNENQQIGRQVQNTQFENGTTGLQGMLESAQAMEPGTKSYQQAQKISEKLQNEQKPSNYRVGQLARDMMRESQEQAEQKAADALRNEVRKELAGKEIRGSNAEEMTDLIVKALDAGGIENLTKKEREKIHDSAVGYNTLVKFQFASEQSSRALAAQTEATQAERKAMQSVSDALTQKKTQTVTDDFVGKQLATQDDIDRAEGKRTKQPDEVIVDRKFGKLEGMELDEQNGEWKYRVNVDGKTELKDASEIKATNFSTAALVRQQLDNPVVYSGDYVNHLMKQINSRQSTKIGNYLRDAENVRWSAFFGEDIPATGLSEEDAKEIYRISQADLRSEWMKDQASRQANYLGKGNGIASFGGVEFGSEEWSRKLDESGLTEDEKKTVNGLAGLAVSSGIQFNFVDQINNNDYIHGSEAQSGITIAIRSFDSDQAKAAGQKHEMIVTVGHELTHWLRRNNAAGYIELQNYVVNTMKDRGVNIHARAQELMDNRRKAGDNLTMSGAIEEMVANACDQVMASQEAADYLEKNNPGLYDKIRSYVKDLVQRIKTMFAEKKGWDSASRDAVYNMGLVGEQVNELNRIWWGKFDEVLSGQVKKLEAAQPAEEQTEKAAASMTENELEERYSRAEEDYNFDPDFEKNIRLFKNNQTEFKKQNGDSEIVVGNTFKILQDIGIDNKPLVIDQKHLTMAFDNTTEKNHKMTPDEMIEIIKKANHPIAIIKSRSIGQENNSVVMLIDHEINGHTTMIPVRVSTEGYSNQLVFDANKIASVHSRHNLRNLLIDAVNTELEGKKPGIYYVNKNKADFLRREGVQFPSSAKNNGLIHNINENPDFVKQTANHPQETKAVMDKMNFSMAEEAMPLEDALREWDEAKKERDELRKQYQELNGSKEHMDMLRKVQDAMNTPEADAAIEEYSRWEKETGLGDLARRYEEAKKRTDQAAKNYDRAYNAAQEAEEREAIAKSGLSEQDWRRKQAVKEFGYTTNFREAGYLLPNGQMLNFTGEKGKHYGTRGQDHRAIGTIYAGDRYTGSEAMLKFMDEGNIRVMAETPGIDISSTNEPTSEQYSTIRKMARQFASEEYFNIDFTDARGNTVDSIEYDGRVNPEKIVNDIKYFFRTGAAPQQSLVSQFHYSMAEDDAADVGVWMMGLTESSVHTEGERALIREYRGLRTSLDLCRKRQIEYRDKIRQIQKKSQLTAEDRDTLIILQNKLQVQQDKQARLEQELYDVTRSEGYAGMMYRNSRIFDDYVNGKNQAQVEAAVDRMMAESDQMVKNIEKRAKKLRQMREDMALDTIRKEMRKRGLRENAKALKEQYWTTMTQNELEGRLAEIILRAVNGEQDIKTWVDSLAMDIISSPINQNEEYARDALDKLRGRTIVINKEQQAELKGAKGWGLKALRDAMRGSGIKFEFGDVSTLEQDWQDLEQENTGLQGKMSGSGQSIIDFVDYVQDLLEGLKGDPKDFNFSQDELSFVIATCAQTMLSEESGGMSMAALRDRISKAQGEIGAVADAVDKMLESAKAIKGSAMKASNAAGGLRGDAVAAIDYYNLIAKQAAEVERNRVKRTVIEELRSENTKKLIEQQQKYQEMMKKDRRARELQHDNEQLRKVITTDVKRLKDRLIAETDQKNVQEEAKPLARQLVSMLVNHDMAGFRHVLFSDKKTLTDVQQRLAKMEAANGSFDMDADLDFLVIKAPNAEDNDYSLKDKVLEDLMHIEQGLLEYRNAEGKGNVSLADRKAALEKVQKAVSEIYDVIRARETAFINGQRQNVMALAKQLERDMESSRFKGERRGRGSKAKDTFWGAVGWGNLTPEYFFKNLRNGTLELLHSGMQDAEQNSGLQARAAKMRMEQIAKDTGFNSWDGQEKKTVTLTNGKQIQMSVEQLMALYATWNREKNALRPEETSHLLKGGFMLAEGDTTEGKARRERISQRPIRVNEDDLNSIGSYLTDQQKEFADAVVEYMSSDLAQLGNEASLKAYGIRKFTESYYFPTKVWNGVLNRSSASGISNQNDNRAMRQSFTKRIQAGAKNPLIIGDFTATAMKHITGMITFNTVGPAVENLNKVLNQQLDYYEDEEMDPDEAYKRNMRTAFEENYGVAAMNYLKQFMQDVNGGVSRRLETSPREKLLSVFRKGAVAGSMSVALQQPLSYIRAAMMINPKYMLQALSPTEWGRINSEMMQYSGLAVIKKMGRFDMNQGQSMIEYITPEGQESKGQKAWNKFSKGTTIMPEKMDEITWGRMWIACKLETAAKNPTMDKASPEFLEMVADRFNEVVRKTQVYDSVMVKSQNMRSNNYAIKMMTSFMAEPTLSLNVLADAVQNVKEKGGKENLAKAGATFVLSAVMQAFFKALMSSGRSPDKKKTWAEQFLTKWANLFMSEVNPFSLIPGYSDIIELLKNGELTDDAMSVIGKFKTMIETASKVITGKEKVGYRTVEDTVGQLAQIFTNVPAKNLMRDMRAMYNFFNPDTYAKRETSGAVIKYGILDAIHNQDNLAGVINSYLVSMGTGYDSKTTAYYKRIIREAGKDNDKAAAEMKEYLTLGRGVNGDSMAAGLTKEIRNAYRDDKLSRSKAEKLYKAEKPNATKKTITAALDEIDYKKEGNSTGKYSNYTPLYDAISTNRSDQIHEAVQHMIDTGYTAKDIKTQITKQYKPQYVAADEKEKIRLRNAIHMVYKEIGLTAEDADKIINGWTKEKKEGSSAIPGMVGVIGGNGMSDVGSKKKSGNYGKGTINLDDRPIVVNKDGTISTERSFSFWDEDEQKEILIPTVINGKIVSERKAIDHYYETGEYLGKFDTWQEADEYAEQTHSRFEIPNEDGTPYIANYNGKRIVLDSVIDGEAVSFEEAFQWYLESGDMLASFKTYKEAQRYVKSIMK